MPSEDYQIRRVHQNVTLLPFQKWDESIHRLIHIPSHEDVGLDDLSMLVG